MHVVRSLRTTTRPVAATEDHHLHSDRQARGPGTLLPYPIRPPHPHWIASSPDGQPSTYASTDTHRPMHPATERQILLRALRQLRRCHRPGVLPSLDPNLRRGSLSSAHRKGHPYHGLHRLHPRQARPPSVGDSNSNPRSVSIQPARLWLLQP